jgi:hypothetical protein
MDAKIALCFLTYGNLSKPELWKNFINPNYNIYIHNKYKFKGEFEKYCIKDKVKTEWSHISLVKATLKLFNEAFKNKQNEYFILLSDKCIPLYNPDTIYNNIKRIDNNLIMCFKQNEERINNLQDKKFLTKDEFMKQHQWMCLKRETIKFLIENDFTQKFGEKFKYSDEHYFINVINKYNISFINRQITYVNWNSKKRSKAHPQTYLSLTNENIENILESNCFFMRKVDLKCKLPSYFNKIKPLKFIHITKTGGTSIEIIGKKHGISWGMYHKEYKWWHKKFINKPKSLKSKYNWFVVVRNPYTRIISEFYCKWGTQIKNDKYTISKSEFNKIIKNHILKKENFKNHGQSGHYSEQYKYIDKNYNIHIIKFENIKEEFNNLMKKYSLDIELEEHENKGKKLFTVNSLSKDVIKLINTIYDKDFESFGYKKISSN